MSTIKHQDEPITSHDQATKTTIFYYSGTGNSLWAARVLAEELGNTEIIPMVNWQLKKQTINSPVIGLIFPVHIWGVPSRVLRFLDDLKAMSPDYIFAIANNAGQVSNTLVQLKQVMAAMDLTLSSGWSIMMPSNYIPWGGPGPLEEQNKCFQETGKKLSAIADKIRSQTMMPVEKGPLWQRIIFTGFYKFALPYVPKMDEKFWADARCNQCGLCAEICPAGNIELLNEKLIWYNHCEQCLACIQWCPQEALQYGQKTAAYARYHHPEIKAKDLLS